jgi:hypothetical protein
MRTTGSLLAAVALALSACGAGSQQGDRPQASLGGGGSGPTSIERTADVYSAVVRQLVTKDHTFGTAPSPFKRVYIVDGVVADAGGPRMPAYAEVKRPFAAAVKSRMLESLDDLRPIEFVADPSSVVVDRNDCPRVKADGVLLSLGPISGGAQRVTVPNGLFFACLGGQWLTYVLEPKGDVWTVVGTKGPVAIS